MYTTLTTCAAAAATTSPAHRTVFVTRRMVYPPFCIIDNNNNNNNTRESTHPDPTAVLHRAPFPQRRRGHQLYYNVRFWRAILARIPSFLSSFTHPRPCRATPAIDAPPCGECRSDDSSCHQPSGNVPGQKSATIRWRGEAFFLTTTGSRGKMMGARNDSPIYAYTAVDSLASQSNRRRNGHSSNTHRLYSSP